MKTVYLNARTLNTKQELHEYIKKAFCFPEYYGGNLDALHDCLGDLTEEYAVVFKGMEKAKGFMSGAYEVFLDVAENSKYLFVAVDENKATEETNEN